MKKRLGSIVLCCLLTTTVMAQGIPYKFRIRYGDYTPLANTGFIISGYRLTTDPQGIIDLKFTEEINYVNIESISNKEYEIRYPLEGKAFLPKDPNTFIDIYVARPGPDPLMQIRADIKRSQTAFQNVLIEKLEEESRKGYDGIIELLNEKHIDEARLMEGKLEFLPLISSALNNYLNEARNFNDAFLALSKSLNNNGSYEQLNNTIYKYNDIFNLLNANRDIYQQAIATYWNSKELSLKFSNLIDFAIEDLHRPFILEINYTLINRLYEFSQEKNKRKRKEDGKVLQRDMEVLSSSMSRRLLSLGERITNMNAELKNN